MNKIISSKHGGLLVHYETKVLTTTTADLSEPHLSEPPDYPNSNLMKFMEILVPIK